MAYLSLLLAVYIGRLYGRPVMYWNVNHSSHMLNWHINITFTRSIGTLCASLHDGEEIYLGRALVVPWTGTDYRLGYVLLRRLMAAYVVPRLTDGSLPHFLATESYDRWPESDPQWGTDGVR